MICLECERCWNYMVSEVGCYGGSLPCSSYITDGDEGTMFENDDEEGAVFDYN